MKNFLPFLFLIFFAACTNPGTTTPCVCPCDSTVVVVPPNPIGTGGDASKIGTCLFTWTPTALMDTFDVVRAYISAEFISTESGIFVEPIFRSRTDDGKGLDTWIKNLNNKGAIPILCINQTPAWFWNGTQMAMSAPQMSQSVADAVTYDPHASFKRFMSGPNLAARALSATNGPEHPPVKPGFSRTDPKSYETYARIFGELAKRYGSKKHTEFWVNSTPRWNNDPPNEKLSGLGYKFALEVFNEPEPFWRKGDGSGVYMEPEEYAALYAACYFSIQKADDKVPVYMAGLTGFDIDYLRRFATALQALKCPVPDFNLHNYSHYGNKLGVWPPTWFDNGACPPELDLNFPTIKPIVELAKQYGKKVVVTEFGLDIRQPSWMYAPPIGNRTSDQLQGDWNCRTYLEYIRYGVSAMTMFTGNDELGAGMFTSCGLLTNESVGFKPKPSYYAVSLLKKELTGVSFTKDESTPQTRIMRFEGGGVVKYAYWSPTASGATFQAQVAGKSVNVTEQVKFIR